MSDEPVRIDVWLWRARFFKTRSLAQDYIASRGVRLTRGEQTQKITKPAANVRAGDILTFSQRRLIQTVQILSPGTRRGPAPEAAGLYQILEGER